MLARNISREQHERSNAFASAPTSIPTSTSTSRSISASRPTVAVCAKQAPKARPIPARGEAPRITPLQARALKARPITLSIPHISLIALDAISLQKRSHLVLKRMFAMILFLRLNILNQRIAVRWPNGECRVTALPGKFLQRWRFRLQPFGRRTLQFLDKIGNTFRSRDTDGEMNMIGHTSNAIAFTTRIANDNSEIGMQFATHIFARKRITLFRAEGNVYQQKTQRLGHDANYRSGFQPSSVSTPRSWGLAPRWYSVAPLALGFVAIAMLTGCNSAHTSATNTQNTGPSSRPA